MEYIKMLTTSIAILMIFCAYYLEILSSYLFIVYKRKDADDITWKDLAISGIIAIVTLPFVLIFIAYFVGIVSIFIRSITG